MSVQIDKPMTEIQRLMNEAKKTHGCVANLVVLATVDDTGQPSARNVFLDHVDENGFIFFTSINSRKAAHLAHNPKAGMCLYWSQLRRQIQIEGNVDVLSGEESALYWPAHNRDAQLAAWSSEFEDQTLPIEKRMADLRSQYAFERVPNAPGWVGYRLKPERIDIWKTGWSRPQAHICYVLNEEAWDVTNNEP